MGRRGDLPSWQVKSKGLTFELSNPARWAGAVSARNASRARNIARNLAPSERENAQLGAGRRPPTWIDWFSVGLKVCRTALRPIDVVMNLQDWLV